MVIQQDNYEILRTYAICVRIFPVCRRTNIGIGSIPLFDKFYLCDAFELVCQEAFSYLLGNSGSHMYNGNPLPKDR